jgi:hypothetical protein
MVWPVRCRKLGFNSFVSESIARSHRNETFLSVKTCVVVLFIWFPFMLIMLLCFKPAGPNDAHFSSVTVHVQISNDKRSENMINGLML